jgi:hypothetical protein
VVVQQEDPDRARCSHQFPSSSLRPYVEAPRIGLLTRLGNIVADVNLL